MQPLSSNLIRMALTLMNIVLVLCSSVIFSSNVIADEQLDALVKKVTPEIIEKRHFIHQNPELGNREFKTAKLIADYLKAHGLEVETGIAKTGVVGILRGGKPGPVVAVRADMDALPVTENTGYPFASTVKTTYLDKEVGVSHACGHDIHVAVQLGVVAVLSAMREQIPGTIQFIFQPAEEGPPPGEEGGAEVMLAEGIFKKTKPTAIFGLHTYTGLDVGKVGYTPGPTYAAVDHFYIDVIGQQSHGAAPEYSIDPVVMASRVVMALQTIRSRNLSPLEPSVITVGIIDGGERFNIIPGKVHLEGTVRTYNADVRDTIEKRMQAIVKGITESEGGSYTFEYERGSPATINNIELTEKMVPSLEKSLGKDNVVELPPTMGGEDFSFYALEVPGFFYRLGTVKPGTTSGVNHTPDFKADDSAIPVGIEAMATLLLDYLESGGVIKN